MILLAVIALVFYLALLSTTPSGAQTGGDCPGAEVVEEINGSGDDQTPPFDIAGNRFQITSDVSGNTDFPFFSIDVRDEDGIIATIDPEGEGTDVSTVNEGPGEFFLDVAAANVEYTITVEDCTGTTQNDQDVTDGELTEEVLVDEELTEDLQEDVIIEEPTTREQSRNKPVVNIPNKPLPPTGGLPVYGTVAGFILVGAGLLGLGVGIRRGQRR